ncbi:hypothetical protein IFT69_26510 [Pseudomonas putida]|nr:hypothetical protein [Pseudomonas putida]
MKFDCVKVSGTVDSVRSVYPMNGGYKGTVSIDGSVIPNFAMSSELYEELGVGEKVTLYGIFNNSSKKEKNHGMLYGLEKQGGERMFDTNQRLKVPIAMTGFGVIAFFLMFVVGWFPSLCVLRLIFGLSPDIVYNATVLTVVEASLAALFFFWRAWVMLTATANPDAWKTIEPGTLSNRFSKFDK